MTLEVHKYAEGINQAWESPLKPGALVLYMDDMEMWGARRQLLKQAHVACMHIHMPSTGEGLLDGLAEALDLLREHGPSELLVIASGAAVLPALASLPALCPAKLLLVNPQPSEAVRDIYSLAKRGKEDISAVPDIKVMWKRGDAFAEDVADHLAAVALHLQEIELEDFSFFAASLILSAAYADSFARDYFELPKEAENILTE